VRVEGRDAARIASVAAVARISPVAAIASVVTGALYLYLARVLHARRVSAEAAMARDMFALWWALLGLLNFIGVIQVALYRAGDLPIWLYLTLGQLGIWALFAALWALQVYLMYLYTGSKRWVVPLGVFYLVLYMSVVALIHWIGPPGAIGDNGWTLRTDQTFQLSRGWTVALLLVLLGPQMAAALAYARLYRKTNDRTQRYRIALLTGAILVWFGTSALVGATSDPNPDHVNVPWQIASRLLSMAAALTILAAYRPPLWVRRRFAVRSLDDEAMPAVAAGGHTP
jgi:hypothetical protein